MFVVGEFGATTVPPAPDTNVQTPVAGAIGALPAMVATVCTAGLKQYSKSGPAFAKGDAFENTVMLISSKFAVPHGPF